MKKLILLVLLLPSLVLLLPSLVFAGSVQQKHRSVIARLNIASAGGDSQNWPDGCDAETFDSFGSSTIHLTGIEFVPSNTYTSSSTVCLSVSLAKVGSPGNGVIAIYTESGGLPGASIGSATIVGASVTTVKADYSYSITLSAELTASTSYFIVGDETTYDGNYYKLYRCTENEGDSFVRNLTGASWAVTTTNDAAKYQLSSGTCP